MQGACEEYGSALRLCQELATQEEHNLELRDFFVGRATQTIEPLVRYCQYELGKDAAGGGSQDELQQLLQQNSATSAQLRRKLDSLQNERLASEASEGSMSTLSFRGQNIFVDDNQVRVTLLKISKDLQQVPGSEFDEEKLLQLLTECDTASSIVSAQLKEYNSKKSGPAVNKKRLELECLLGYIKYQQLKERMGRNERMINELRSETTNTTKRLEEICHLYDALLQDARAVVGLPGGPKSSTDDDTHQDEEDEFVLEANAHVLRIRALRCYYIGSLYASPSGLKKDPAKAVALLEQASLLAAQAVEEIAACENMEGGDAYLTSMEDLEGDIRVAKCRAAASAYILSAGSGMMSSKSVSRSLLERLDDATIHDSDVLAHVPPKPEPIPCKPTFFDIALNHINTEPPVAQLQQHIADLEKGQGGSSLLGWFRRT
jgi:signal recognition particle subunit SRP68